MPEIADLATDGDFENFLPAFSADLMWILIEFGCHDIWNINCKKTWQRKVKRLYNGKSER